MLPLRDHLPTRRFPVVNVALIGANVAAFVWEQLAIHRGGASTQSIVFGWGLVPARFVHAPLEEAPTLLTSMFLHDPRGWAHLAANMLFLWIFGDNVEDALGRGRYVVFYLLAGLAAAAAQIGVDPSSADAMVGASGAIAGVVAAYGSLYPRAPVTMLNPVPLLWIFFGVFVRFPAWVVILQFFAFNLWSGLAGGSGVAVFAHIGGFVAGLLLVRSLLPRAPEPPPRPRPRRRFPAEIVDPYLDDGPSRERLRSRWPLTW